MIRYVAVFSLIWSLVSHVVYFWLFNSSKSQRNIALKAAGFGLLTAMVAVTLLVFIVAFF